MKINIRDISLYYETYGEGQPVVCLHGWNESSSVFRSAAYRRLLRGHKVYALDLPGFGESQGLRKYDFEGLTDIIDGFAGAMGLDYFGLAGQCMGGIIALDYAIRYSEKVSNLVLIETMIFFPVWMNLLLIEFLSLPVLRMMLKRKLGLKVMQMHKALKRSNIDERLADMFRKADAECSVKYIRLMKEYSKHDHLMRAKVLGDTEVTVIIADNTFKEVKKTAEGLRQSLSNARIINIPGRNHFLYLDESDHRRRINI